MISEVQNSLLRLCDTTVSRLSAYLEELDKKAKKDKKAYTAEHYSFLCVITDISEQLDAVLLDITAELEKAEEENNDEKTKIFTSLFDRGLLLKNTVEGFFSSSEDVLKNDDFYNKLKKLTEVTLRKAIQIKGTYNLPIL